MVVSNHNRCLDAPARQLTEPVHKPLNGLRHASNARLTGRAQAPLGSIAILRGRCLVELSEISHRQTIKTKGKRAPQLLFSFSFSSLTTLFQSLSELSRRHCYYTHSLLNCYTSPVLLAHCSLSSNKQTRSEFKSTTQFSTTIKMQFSTLLIAAGAAVVAADSTSTLTATTTKTYTITQCPETVTNCPYRTPTVPVTTSEAASTTEATSAVEITTSAAETSSAAPTSHYWPVSNSTTATAAGTNPVGTGAPTTIVTIPSGTGVQPTGPAASGPAGTGSAPPTVPTSGATKEMAQSGVIAVALAAVFALVF